MAEMIRLINPRDNKADFDSVKNLLNRCLINSDSLKFLSTSLIPFDENDIGNILEEQISEGVEFLVHETNNTFSDLLLYKCSKWQGFELFLLAVDSQYQKQGIGQRLTAECLDIALNHQYQAVDAMVYSDNKKMLSLLINQDFRPIDMQFHSRADGMDMVKLRKYI